jgi:hypothetical protein
MLPSTTITTHPHDVRVVVQAKHSETLTAQSPFPKEEDVTITLGNVHDVLLRLLNNWRGR